MESTSGYIELKLISCKSLRGFNFFQKLTVYALVYITSDDGKQLQNQKTPTDRDGDGNPEWNHTIRFEVSDDLLRDRDKFCIHFELFHEGAMFGDKPIGEVIVSLVDLIKESSNGVVRFVTYQVRTRDGKSNGELNFSYKVEINNDFSKMESPSSVSLISGYPVFHRPELEFCSSEVESGSPRVQYPVLDLQDMFVQGPHRIQENETNYFQPQNGYYHHQQPPPPAPPLPYPPPPAAVEHDGAYSYHYPPPPSSSGYSELWGPSPNGSVHGYWTHGGSQMGSGDVVELETTWSNGWQSVGMGGSYHHSTSGNGW